MDPLELLRTGVASYEPFLQPDGELADPVYGEPCQYGTPYHAYCQAVLALFEPPAARAARVDRALRGLDAAVRHVADPAAPPPLSGFCRETGAATRANHRDFFWPAILKTYRLLKGLGVPGMEAYARRIAAADITAAFAQRPPANWAAVWLSGEWLHMREGLSPVSLAQFDDWLGAFFRQHILLPMGLYQEPGHPNSYDLFTRVHLAEILAEGYNGRWRDALAELMATGLDRSLAVQLSDGSLASAHRSTGQTWTLGAQVAYFILAAHHWRDHDPARSQAAAGAAARALMAMARWQRPGGPYSPVENRLPPSYRVGYEPYTADAHYGNLALAFLATALLHGYRDLAATHPGAGGPRPPLVHIEGDPTHRAVLHHGPCSAHVNALPAPQYDAFGLVDVTFGPGRYLHFVSSARFLSEPRLYNLGLALRAGGGRAEVRPLCQERMVLVGPMARGPAPASVRLRARAQGDPYLYELTVTVHPDGVECHEATPHRPGPKTLLVPYLRDCGLGCTTTVRVAGRAVYFSLGREVVELALDCDIEHALDLPYGYENRRGLCGLLRLDLQGDLEAVRYRLRPVE